MYILKVFELFSACLHEVTPNDTIIIDKWSHECQARPVKLVKHVKLKPILLKLSISDVF